MKYTSFPGGGFPAHTGLENGRLNTRNEKERFDGGRGGFTRNKKRKREMLLRKFSPRVTGPPCAADLTVRGCTSATARSKGGSRAIQNRQRVPCAA